MWYWTECERKAVVVHSVYEINSVWAKTRALRHAGDERYRKGMTGMSGEHLCTASEV